MNKKSKSFQWDNTTKDENSYKNLLFEFLMIYGLTILAAIIVAVIAVYFLPSYNPQFKITKEVCEENIGELTACKLGCDYDFIFYNDVRYVSLIDNVKYDCYKFCDKEIIKLCHQEEVSEINLKASICFVNSDGSVDKECANDFSHPITLTKEDLTIDWLNENAEIYWCDFKKERNELYSHFDEEYGNCDYFKSIENDFNRWKLNEYIIEVKR